MNLKDSLSYQEKVGKLQQFLQQSSSADRVSLYKTSSNLFRSIDRSKKKSAIDAREFNQVIRVDTESLIAEVEGMTSYDALVRETLKQGLLPAIVPQLKSITVGGAYAGGGVESSSFRYGLVHDTVSEADLLLGDGSVVQCSPHNSHRDLFYAFPNTYGSLGYALKLKLQLISAKPFVRLRHIPYSSAENFFKAIHELCSKARADGQPAFIDGVIFSSREMYITIGEFTDTAPYISDYTYSRIYYKSIQERSEDYLTTSHYIWRWDADWFWCSKVFFMQNPFIRLLFGKFMLSSAIYSRIMHLVDSNPLLRSLNTFFNPSRESVIQDILIPVSRAKDFFDFYEKEIKITPLWVCPTFSTGARYDFCPVALDTLYLDFGFWDSIKSSYPQGFYNRKIEQTTKLLGGFKSLYSRSYYTEEEFWQIYNRPLYETIKQKYDPQGRFKDLYRKVSSAL